MHLIAQCALHVHKFKVQIGCYSHTDWRVLAADPTTFFSSIYLRWLISRGQNALVSTVYSHRWSADVCSPINCVIRIYAGGICLPIHWINSLLSVRYPSRVCVRAPFFIVIVVDRHKSRLREPWKKAWVITKCSIFPLHWWCWQKCVWGKVGRFFRSHFNAGQLMFTYISNDFRTHTHTKKTVQ